MNDHGTGKPPGVNQARLLKMVIGIVIFGLLMGVYTQLGPTWLRILIAACAGGVLGWVLVQARTRKG